MKWARFQIAAIVVCSASLTAAPTAIGEIGDADAISPAPAIPFVDYDQDSPKWGRRTYRPGGSMSAKGCGPTAVAMAVRHLTGDERVDPMTIADRFGDKHHLKNGGSHHSLIPAVGRAYGLSVHPIGRQLAQARRAIQAGGLVIALVRGRPFTTRGHFIVLRDTHFGKFTVSDPNSRNNHLERRRFTASQIRAAGLAKMWVYAEAVETLPLAAG